MKAKKSLGQHFLKSARIATRIADTARLTERDTVLEVGPGDGVLTRALLARAGRVIAIEKDRRLIEPLREKFASDIAAGTLELIEADALTFNPRAYGLAPSAYAVVANIPYYITGALIEKLLTDEVRPQHVVLLMQKEVAQRIAKDTKGSVLSISVRAYGEPHYVRTIPARHFSPRPKVDSAILLVENISRARFKNVPEGVFFRVLKAGFAHKRKRLASNLRDRFGKEAVAEAFLTLNIPEKARAEELSVNQWSLLATLLKSHS